MPVDPPLRVVYRALLGGYETLREEPVAHESGADFVCFTDDPDLTSETWRLILVEPRFPADLVRSARHLKIVGHPVLETYDETLWLDNTVELLVPPEEIFDDWLADADLALPLHSYRASVVDEAEAVLELGRDDYVRVYEQMSVYARTAPAALEANPHWTGMLARRRVPMVREAMQDWWSTSCASPTATSSRSWPRSRDRVCGSGRWRWTTRRRGCTGGRGRRTAAPTGPARPSATRCGRRGPR